MVHGPWWTDAPVYGGPRLLPVSRVHPPLLCLWFTCTGFMHGWPARGVFPCFSHGGAAASGELTMSLRGGAGVQLGREKATPGYGDCDGGG